MTPLSGFVWATPCQRIYQLVRNRYSPFLSCRQCYTIVTKKKEKKLQALKEFILTSWTLQSGQSRSEYKSSLKILLHFKNQIHCVFFSSFKKLHPVTNTTIIPLWVDQGIKRAIFYIVTRLAYGPITSWQIDGEELETVTDLIFVGFKITADSDCNHEIKRCLLLGRKTMINLDSMLKSRDITLPTKVHLLKAMVFPVVMYGCEKWSKVK